MDLILGNCIWNGRIYVERNQRNSLNESQYVDELISNCKSGFPNLVRIQVFLADHTSLV